MIVALTILLLVVPLLAGIIGVIVDEDGLGSFILYSLGTLLAILFATLICLISLLITIYLTNILEV